MKNVVVVGMNYEMVLKLSKQLAKILKCKLLDAQQQFNSVLLKYASKPSLLLNEELEAQETLLCAKLSKTANVVAVPDDMFLSNENYDTFAGSTKILVLSGTKSKLKIGIENLLKMHTNFQIDCKTDLETFAKNLKI